MGRVHQGPGWHHVPVAVAILFLLVPMASAASIEDFSFSQASIEGPFSSAGSMEATFIEATNGFGGLKLSGLAMVEIEYLQSNITVPGATGQSYTDVESQDVEFLGAALELSDFAELMLYDLLGDHQGSFLSGGLNSGGGTIQWPQSLHRERAPPVVQTDSLVSMSSPGGSFTIEGNFSFSLWNGQITQGDNEFWAGDRVQPFENGIDLTSAGIGENRQQILHVHVTEGVLEVPQIPFTHTSYWSKTALSGTGGIVLQEAVTLTGALLGEVQATDDWSLVVDQENGLTGRNFEGESVEVNGVTVQQSQTNPVWWLLTILLLVPIALLVRNTPGAQVQQLERLLNKSQYEKIAAKPLHRILKTKHASRASLYRTTSLLALGLHQEAELFLESLPRAARPDPATYHFLYAHAVASQKRRMDAAKHLLKCLKMAPEYAKEAEAIDVLRPILGSISIARDINHDSYS